MTPTTRDAHGGRDHTAVVLDQLPDDRSAAIVKIAADLDMEPAEVLAWAVDLLTRYVDAGGEP
jgi:hypothetical protein